jgi:hypothetical protein
MAEGHAVSAKVAIAAALLPLMIIVVALVLLLG